MKAIMLKKVNSREKVARKEGLKKGLRERLLGYKNQQGQMAFLVLLMPGNLEITVR